MNEILRRRRGMMVAKDQITIQKEVFTVTTDKTTTGSGGNTLAFFNEYGGNENGLYVFRVTNNLTASHYVQHAIQDRRNGDNYRVLRRYPTETVTSIASNYDAFLKSGAIITRYFIPQKAFEVDTVFDKTEFDVITDKITTSSGNTRIFYNDYCITGNGISIYEITGNQASNGYAVSYSFLDATESKYYFKRYPNNVTAFSDNTYDMFLKTGTKITRLFLPENML